MTDYYGQEAFLVRLEWGRRGAERASARGDVLVIVDVLSFSTLATFAASRNVVLYPCATQEEVEKTALRVGAVAAQKSRAVTQPGSYSLSPATFEVAPPGTQIAIASPNGATCCRLATGCPRVFVAGITNAQAAAALVMQALGETGKSVTLLACGERWTSVIETDDGSLRFALEDMLGAGAIAAHLPPHLSRSPEAQAAEAVFRATQHPLLETLLTCGSGIELVERGFSDDVHRAALLNQFEAVPILVDGERLERVL